MQAEQIIQRMEENKDSAIRPDAVTYTSLMKCWIQSGRSKAMNRSIEILDILEQRYREGHEECKPDALAYNVALNAIAKNKAPDSAERAEGKLLNVRMLLDHYLHQHAHLYSYHSFAAAYERTILCGRQRSRTKRIIIYNSHGDMGTVEKTRCGKAS